MAVPGTVGTDGQLPPQPQPPPPLVPGAGQELVAAFAARPGRRLAESAQPAETNHTAAAAAAAEEEEEDSFDAAISAAIEDDGDETAGGERCCCCAVIDESAPFRRRWDMVQVVALLYVAVLVPIRTGFSQELEPLSSAWWVELCVDVYFIIDLFLNFMTSYYDSDGVLVRNTREIAMHYAKGWLLLDVVSCLPISYGTAIMQATSTSAAQGSPPNTKVFKILRLLRLAKLLRLGRLKKIIKRYEEEFEVCAAPRSLTQKDRFRTATSVSVSSIATLCLACRI
jgi:hypothetical protein